MPMRAIYLHTYLPACMHAPVYTRMCYFLHQTSQQCLSSPPTITSALQQQPSLKDSFSSYSLVINCLHTCLDTYAHACHLSTYLPTRTHAHMYTRMWYFRNQASQQCLSPPPTITSALHQPSLKDPFSSYSLVITCLHTCLDTYAHACHLSTYLPTRRHACTHIYENVLFP